MAACFSRRQGDKVGLQSSINSGTSSQPAFLFLHARSLFPSSRPCITYFFYLVRAVELVMFRTSLSRQLLRCGNSPFRHTGQALRVRQTSLQRRTKCSSESIGTPKCSKAAAVTPSITSLGFWSSRPTWGRAGINTFRCLVGCTLGDFSAMWFLQACYPEIGVGAIMTISSKYFFLTAWIIWPSPMLMILQWQVAFPRPCC